AQRAEARGAFLVSARALERAAELTADGPTRGRRLAFAARAASVAGAHERAVALAAVAAPLADEPLPRAEIAQAVALAEIMCGRPIDAGPALIDAATQVAPFDSDKALELLLYALMAANDGGDLGVRLEAAELGAVIAAEHPNE